MGGWIAVYLIGAAGTAWFMSGFGWLPGTSRAWKVTATTVFIGLWPATLLLFLVSAVASIGTPRR